MDIQLQNIANKGRKIFLFCRKDNGAQEIIEDNTFFPYWFEPDEKGTFVGYDNTKLRKVFASNPSEISKLRSKQSYSSDILFTKRYIIDKVDKIDISPIKYLFLDIEIQATDLPDTHEAKYPISCITIYNSLYKKIQTWWLPDFPSEKVMLIDFVKYIQEERPDILLAWNMKFDYDYLFHRIKDFAKDISPIHQTRYGEEDGVFYPAGISIVDYLILFRKVYMREPSYALDNIAQKYLQEKTFQKVDYSKLDLNIKEKNINDIRRMVKLEQKFELLSYYNEIRILCLSPDTWITCEGGNIKKLEDIQIGEKIIGTRLDSYKSFKPQIVLNKKEVYIESYKINTNSQFIISSKKHKFLIFKNDIDKIHYTRFKWEEVQNLKSGDVLIQWINYKKQPTNFRDDWFYLMGFYYGDGSSTGKGSKLSISDKDIKNLKIIEKICNKFNIKTTIKKSKYQNSYILEFYNSEFGYLKNKYIPINLPIEYQLSFIAGIFDAEGCVNSKNSLTISQKEPKLIYWISSILFSLGLPNRVFKKNYQYYLVVYDLMNFNRIIHIKSPKKLKKLYNYIKTKRVREYFDTLPIVFLLKKLMIYGKLSRGSGWRKNRKYFSSFKDMEIFHKNLKCSKVIQQAWIKNKNISRNKAWEYFKEIQEKTFLKSYSFKKLSKQIEFILTHVFCAKITSIKKNKTKEKLIDIEVTNENFIANNFASHNSKCLWEDLYHNSRIMEMLLFEEAKQKNIVLPNKKTVENPESFQGATRDILRSGVFTNVGKLDLGSAYPSMMVNFCLDNQNLNTNKEGVNINGIYFNQNTNALLPSIVNKILQLKTVLKEQKTQSPNDKVIATKYDAIKGIVNSSFGTIGNEYFRIYNPLIVASITYLVRDVLMYVKDRLNQEGYEVIYWDTDAVMVTTKKDIAEKLNEFVQDWVRIKYNKDSIDLYFEYEGYFEKLFLLGKCHYVGYLRKGNDLQKEIKGVEIKRSSSTKFEAEFQNDLIDKILNNEKQEDIEKWIKRERMRLRQKPIEYIAFPCKINTTSYINEPIFVRALRNTKKIKSTFKLNVGERFYYIYVQPRGEIDVIGFTEEDKQFVEDFKIDWIKVEQRNIFSKVERIFECLNWQSSLDNQQKLF